MRLLLLALFFSSNVLAASQIVIRYDNTGTLTTTQPLTIGSAPATNTGTPVTSMRPSWWYIDNTKFPKPAKGIGYVDEFVTPWDPNSGLSGWPGVTSPQPTGFGYARQPAPSSPCSGGPVYCYQVTEYVGTGSESGYTLVARNSGNFRTICDFSHFAYDDPLVYPGQPGRSHLHAFFGNTGTGGNTTSSDIANKGNSTCSGGINNRTGYWVPAVVYHCPVGGLPTGCNPLLDGLPIPPTFLNAYYKGAHGGGSFTPNGTDIPWAHEEIQPMPVGLHMIAGDPAATPSSPALCSAGGGCVSYTCRSTSGSDGTSSASIHGSGITPDAASCPSGTGSYIMAVTFQPCWNGVDLDSPGHKAHITGNLTAGKCPSGYTSIPGLSELVEYAIDTVSADGVTGRTRGDMKFWRLSSDRYADTLPAGYSGHADWMMGWKAAIMKLIVERCLQPGLDCHNDFLGPKTNSDDTIDTSGSGAPFNGYRTMRGPYIFRTTH